jgi:hypothetical protein
MSNCYLVLVTHIGNALPLRRDAPWWSWTPGYLPTTACTWHSSAMPMFFATCCHRPSSETFCAKIGAASGKQQWSSDTAAGVLSCLTGGQYCFFIVSHLIYIASTPESTPRRPPSAPDRWKCTVRLSQHPALIDGQTLSPGLAIGFTPRCAPTASLRASSCCYRYDCAPASDRPFRVSGLLGHPSRDPGHLGNHAAIVRSCSPIQPATGV